MRLCCDLVGVYTMQERKLRHVDETYPDVEEERQVPKFTFYAGLLIFGSYATQVSAVWRFFMCQDGKKTII